MKFLNFIFLMFLVFFIGCGSEEATKAEVEDSVVTPLDGLTISCPFGCDFEVWSLGGGQSLSNAPLIGSRKLNMGEMIRYNLPMNSSYRIRSAPIPNMLPVFVELDVKIGSEGLSIALMYKPV